MGLRLLTILLLSTALLLGSCARRSTGKAGGAALDDAPSAAPEAEVIVRGAAEFMALAELRSAGELSSAGDFVAGATRSYARARRALPVLRGWTDLLAARAAANAGDTARVRMMLAESPDPELVREWGWRVRITALRQSEGLRRAVVIAREVARDGASPQARAEGWRVAGGLLLQAGDSAQALGTFRRPMQESADVRLALEAARAVVEWKGLSPDDQLLVGRTLLRHAGVERGAWDRRLLAIVYPFPFRGAVEREAARNGLSPFLVAGLIRQESLFNPAAVSPAGAVGLMQVMPETGRSLAERTVVEGFSPAALKDPETNLRLGSLFLAARWTAIVPFLRCSRRTMPDPRA